MARPCLQTMAPPFVFGSRAILATKTPNISLKSSSRTARIFNAKAPALGTAASEDESSPSREASPFRARRQQGRLARMFKHPREELEDKVIVGAVLGANGMAGEAAGSQ